MKINDAAFLIAGGSSGLGAACAEHLLELGASITVADLQQPRFSSGDDRCLFQQTDITDAESLAAAFGAARDRFGPLRGVVTCAGILHAEKILPSQGRCDIAAFRKVIEVNLVGTFLVLRQAAESMRDNEPDEDGQRGAIITTASVAAMEGQIGQAAYAASKGGVAALTLPAARELGRHGIRVVTIAPGVFETPMMRVAPDKVRDALESQTPFPPRFGRPVEFARLAVHVLENTMLNGSVLRLDGALRMPPR